MAKPIVLEEMRQSFVVTYYKEDGTVKGTEVVVPVAYSKWADLIALQDILLKHAVEESVALESFLSDQHLMSTIRSIANILRVRGKAEPGIDVDNILEAGDYLQVARIFLSTSYDADDNAGLQEGYLPSLVASVNQLNFAGKLRSLGQAKQKMELETLMVNQVELEQELQQMVTIEKPETQEPKEKTEKI